MLKFTIDGGCGSGKLKKKVWIFCQMKIVLVAEGCLYSTRHVSNMTLAVWSEWVTL